MVFSVKSLDHLVNVWMPQHFKDHYFFSEELKVLCLHCSLVYNLRCKVFPI